MAAMEPLSGCRLRVAGVVKRAFDLSGWSLKEFAAELGLDERQVSRWMNGQERPHFDRLIALHELHLPLLQAVLELGMNHVVVRTIVSVKGMVA